MFTVKMEDGRSLVANKLYRHIKFIKAISIKTYLSLNLERILLVSSPEEGL